MQITLVPGKSLIGICCSSHPLMIESGRYCNLSRQERLCPFCVVQNIESEEHFILYCPFYTELRRNILPRTDDVKLFFRSGNNLKCLAKYVFLAFKKRERFLSHR